MRAFAIICVFASGLFSSISCLSAGSIPTVAEKPYVLLVSIDGYRFDYNRLHNPKHLTEFAKHAAKVLHFIPSFPTVTFPNHITLVTGLYPAHHGIVSNHFYNHALQQPYSMKIKQAVTDGRFYNGVPLWSLAGQQGLKSATYFWPGSEAKIAGQRPDYWLAYNNDAPNNERVDQVLQWFNLPEAERPQFVTLYFSDVDTAGHHFGPTSNNTYQAVQDIDQAIGQLLAGIQALPFKVNVIITSDHGMANVSGFPRLYTDKLFAGNEALKAKFSFNNDAAFSLVSALGDNKQQDLAVLEVLTKKVPGLQFYRQKDIPAYLHFSDNQSIEDAVLISNQHYITSTDAGAGVTGKHGYDASVITDMNTVLYAQGPAFNQQHIDHADNIHLYPLIAHILGLTITEPIDGQLTVLAPLLAQ
ncbi:ectonucleotide pyrophosphatase/phosphodiesterase [Shewanella sp. MEBiC00475]|uniref:alkaline phosphatase family protein n=1 Tax=Shewanella sp. MEBiC00475 TaxID=2575361 RepID=UPI0010C115C4|nr:ectonucleotide pyrophosphatase/phosphodiesterase [Shewanella sp. MEBiC00475]